VEHDHADQQRLIEWKAACLAQFWLNVIGAIYAELGGSPLGDRRSSIHSSCQPNMAEVLCFVPTCNPIFTQRKRPAIPRNPPPRPFTMHKIARSFFSLTDRPTLRSICRLIYAVRTSQERMKPFCYSGDDLLRNQLRQRTNRIEPRAHTDFWYVPKSFDQLTTALLEYLGTSY